MVKIRVLSFDRLTDWSSRPAKIVLYKVQSNRTNVLYEPSYLPYNGCNRRGGGERHHEGKVAKRTLDEKENNAVALIGLIDSLFKSGTMDEAGAAQMEEMRKREMERLVAKKHRYSICQRGNGLYQTKLQGGKCKTAKTRDELVAWLYGHYYGGGSEPTIESLFFEWMEEKKAFRTSETISKNFHEWEKYVGGQEFVRKPIADVKASELLTYYRSLVADGTMQKRCFNNIKSLINETYDYAITKNIVNANLSRNTRTKNLNFSTEKRRKNDYFDREERERLLSYLHTKGDDFYALAIILQFSLGCRIGELKGLTWDDYDPKRRTVYIHSQVVQRKSGDVERRLTRVNHTKGKSELANRLIPLSDNAVWALERLRGMGRRGEYVLSNRAGRPITTARYDEWLKKYCREAGIDEHSSHDIRRYVISASLEAGIPDSVVQHNSGHLHLSTTMGYKREVGYRQYAQEFINVVQFSCETPPVTSEPVEANPPDPHEQWF